MLWIRFQSTHPKRDETPRIIDIFQFFNISIHSSQTGWDDFITWLLCDVLYFNPLIPNGMRRRHHTNSEAGFDFNPLIPNGMRLYQGHEFDKEHIKFQSTHPKRDETGSNGCEFVYFCISIHSSQTGWDRTNIVWIADKHLFQSTHPKRDETVWKPKLGS